MSAALVIFFVLAGLAVLGAVALIVQSHPIHSALSLILVMLSLAGLYLLMGAEFIAAVLPLPACLWPWRSLASSPWPSRVPAATSLPRQQAAPSPQPRRFP